MVASPAHACIKVKADQARLDIGEAQGGGDV
jgi:hypothetical protein